jgi:putative flippase GtrA
MRFLVVGAVSFVVNEGLLLVLRESVFGSMRGRGPLGLIDPALLLASFIALEASIIVRFVLNDRWTFSGRDGKPLMQRLWQSHLSSFGSPLLCLVTVNLLPNVIGISYLVANSIGVLFGLVWNWVWSTRVVWSVQPSPAEPVEGVLP